MNRSRYSILFEDEQIPQNDPAIDPNETQQMDPNDPNQGGQGEDFEPLIKGPQDVPHSKEKAEVMKIAAQIREIEAKTKETLNKANNPDMGAGMDPNAAGGVDPNTGMPMDPNAAGGQIDPMTGMPMDPNAQQDQNDPLMGLGDASAPQDPMGGMDPMTGMPSPDGGQSKTFTAVGRAYKLKQIYDILESLTSLLHTTSNPRLQELNKEVDSAYDMFRLVINNLKLYKEKVDELIVMYYMLLKDIVSKIEDIFKEDKLETSLSESKLIKKNIKILGEGIEE